MWLTNEANRSCNSNFWILGLISVQLYSHKYKEICCCEKKKVIADRLTSSFCFHCSSVWSPDCFPCINPLFQQLPKSPTTSAEKQSYFLLFLSTNLPKVWIRCRQECRMYFILYSLWIRADHKVCRIQSDMTHGFSIFPVSYGGAYRS